MWLFNRRRKVNPAFSSQAGLPEHIAIIMDGNGRWASKRGLPRSAGHREGANNLKRIVSECNRIGIKYLTVFAFSTENWSRPKNEVNTLMSLLLEFLHNADKELSGQNIRIRIIGESNGLSAEIIREIDRVVHKTESNTGLNLVIALNYGSRNEIVQAAVSIAREIQSGTMKPEDINEKMFSGYLYTADIPDPDLIIRPSGENRLSNFLLWQSSYAEFWYSNALWPDFSKKDLYQAIADYQGRNRRYGGIKG